MQLIDDEPNIDWSFTDMSAQSEDAQEEALNRLYEHVCKTPFDLATGPQIRFHLAKRGKNSFSA